jgi:hypothetical protein
VRRVFIAVGMAIIATSLGGCALLPHDPAADDPIAIRMVHGNLVVAPCEAIHAATIDMESRGPGPNDQWTVFFRAKGSIPVRAGQQFSMSASAPPIDGVTVRRNPHLVNGTTLGLIFSSTREKSVISNDSFTLGPGVVPSDGWLQSDGSVTRTPCVAGS